MVRVDLRTITLNVPPQEVITKDNVPAKVNAVAYFRIVDPSAAVVQVENFLVATSQIAQTTLRSVLGQPELDELLSEREKINALLQEIIDEQTAARGESRSRSSRSRTSRSRRHAAGDGAPGRGRARAPRQGHQRRGRVPGVRAAARRRDRDRGARRSRSSCATCRRCSRSANDQATTIVFPAPTAPSTPSGRPSAAPRRTPTSTLPAARR